MHSVARRIIAPLAAAALVAIAATPGVAQQAPAADTPVTLTSAERAQYVGVYELDTPDGVMRINVYEEGDRLMGLPEHDNEPSTLTPLGEHRFRPVLMQEAVLTFSVEEGRAVSFAIEFPDERGTVIAFRRP